jgi:hypothetical protein
MRLPLEIRRMIYKICIGRIYGGHDQDLLELALGNGIWINVSDGEYDSAFPAIDFGLVVAGIPDRRSLDPNGGPDDLDPVDLFEAYRAAQGHRAGGLRVPAWPTEESAEDPSDESSDEDEEMAECSECSEDGAGRRQPAYEIWVDRAMYLDPDCSGEWCEILETCTCTYRRRGDYDAIRHLSQVSRQVTRELGECVWENATVDFEDPEVFFLFVRERAAAVRYIRGLVLNVQCHADPFDTLTCNLVEICDFASQALDLRFCTVRLFTSLTMELGLQPGKPHLLAHAKVEEWKAAFRRLRVRERFDVRVEPQWVSDTYGEMGSREVGRVRQMLLGLWLPDCLRQRDMMEEAVYLRSRAG